MSELVYTESPMSIANLSAQQLRQAANLKEKIAGLENQLAAILGSESKASVVKPAKKRGMSVAGRARIAAAAKLRWAKVRAAKGKSVAEKVIQAVKKSAKPAVVKPTKKKYKMSAAAKAKLSALMKARWAAKKK